MFRGFLRKASDNFWTALYLDPNEGDPEYPDFCNKDEILGIFGKPCDEDKVEEVLSVAEGSCSKSCSVVEKYDDTGANRVHSPKPSTSGLDVATVKRRLFEHDDEVSGQGLFTKVGRRI